MEALAEKVCIHCGLLLPLEKYHRDKHQADGRTSACAACRTARARGWNVENKERYNANMKAYRDAHPEVIKKTQRKKHVTQTYGITMEQYEAMLEDECPICREPMERPHIDHDHDTLVVRGVLCLKCNTGIGMLRDSPFVLDRAAAYLRSNAEGHPHLVGEVMAITAEKV